MQPRQVPQIAQITQQISQSTLPPIQSPLMPVSQILGQAQQPGPTQAIAEQVQQLAIEIYKDVAVRHIDTGGVDAKYLRELAKDAQIAALAYFQQLGIEFDTGSNAR